MSAGQGSLSFGSLPQVPVTVPTANNGVTISGLDVVLGQNVGQVGNPAALTSIREIPLNGFGVSFLGDSGAVAIGKAVSANVKLDVRRVNTAGVVGRGGRFDSDITFANGTVLASSINMSMDYLHRLSGSINFNNVQGVDITGCVSRFQLADDPASGIAAVATGGANFQGAPSAFNAVSGARGAGNVTQNGFWVNYKSLVQLDTGTKTMQNFADFAAGFSLNTGANAINTRIAFYAPSMQGTAVTNAIAFQQDGVRDINLYAGNSGHGVAAPTARSHYAAQTAAAGSAPIKLTAGAVMAVPENGAFEFDGVNLFFTIGGVRLVVV